MRYLLLLLLLAATAAPAGAQTADLFRKSIGGAPETGELDEADFGLRMDWDEKVERIDSIVRVNDSVTVLVRGLYSKRSLRAGYTPQRLDAVRDTLYHDSLYNRFLSPARVRQGARRRYPQAVTDSTRVIDEEAARRDSASRTVILPIANSEPGAPAAPFVLLTGMLATALYIGISRLYRRLSLFS
ncbi:hypothetical protein [Flaviaesturariibacter terrae]